MGKKIENLYPFGVGANLTQQIRANIDCPSEIEIIVTEGGPAYAWFGDKSAAGALASTQPDGNADFDLAASGQISRCLSLTGGINRITLFAKAATIGFVKITTDEGGHAHVNG